MKKLLIVLTAVAGTLAWSVPALAYRFEFFAMRDAERVAKSEVCFFSATGMRDPFAHFFSSDDVRCLPADDVIEVPPGRWNYFVRSGREWISAGPSLLQGRSGQREEGYKAIVMELRAAAILDVAEARKTLAEDESLMIFVPSPFGAGSTARPVARGEDEVLVPAGTPLIPFVTRDALPIRVGDAVTLEAGQRKAVAFTAPAPGTADLVVWLNLDAELAAGVEGEASLPAPSVAVVSPGGERAPVVAAADGPASHLALQVFRGVPAGAARVVLRGDSWEAAELAVDVPDREVVVVEEPLPLAPAGTVVLQWRAEGAAAGSTAMARGTCDGAAAPANVTEAKMRSLRIIRCAAAASDADCRVVFERELSPDEFEGTVRIGSLTAGVHTAELRVPPFAPVREEIYVAPGRRVDVSLVAAPATIYGSVTRGGEPVRASLVFGNESFVTDDDGAFSAALVRLPATAVPIHVIPCDTRQPFLYQPELPVAANAFLAVDIPVTALEVRVVTRGAAAIDDATVTLTIPEPGQSDSVKAIHTLRHDPERSLYTLAQFMAEESRLCATALRYDTVCIELRKDFDPGDPVVIALEPKRGVPGRIVTDQPIADGVLYVVSPEGDILARSVVGSEGAFDIPSMPSPRSRFLLAAANQPLCTLALQPASSRELVLTPPAARSRHFAVLVARDSAIDRGRLAITVGDVPIPPEVFEVHQQMRHRPPLLDGEHPFFISDIAETGVIAARLLPLTLPADLSVPLPAGSLPAESDLLLLR